MPFASAVQPLSRPSQSVSAPVLGHSKDTFSADSVTRRITQLDIANAAGVHNTTVSLALRNHPSIPLETRERIRSIADQLGYRPDPTLRALMAYRKNVSFRPKTETIAYVSTSPATHESVLYFGGAQRKAAEMGYRLEHFTLPAEGVKPQRLCHMLYHRGIRGILLEGNSGNVLPVTDSADDRVVCVLIGTPPEDYHGPHVRCNWVGSLRLAIKQCLAAGYRKPGLFIPKSFARSTKRDLSVYFLADLSSHLTADKLPIYFEGGDTGAATERLTQGAAANDPAMFRSWFENVRPDVIIGPHCSVTLLLSGTRSSLSAQPGLVDPFALTPPAHVAAVRHCPEIVAAMGLEMLTNKLQQNQPASQQHNLTLLVDGKWQDGTSLPVLAH